MRKRKTILFLGLFLVVLLPLLMPCLLQVGIQLVQYTAEERLERAHLQTLHIAKKDVHWVREGKELLVGFRLFDVKAYHQGCHEVEVTGIFDEEETALEKGLESFWQRHKAAQNTALVKYLQVLGNGCLRHERYQFHPYAFLRNSYTEFRVNLLKDIFITIPNPPPKA